MPPINANRVGWSDAQVAALGLLGRVDRPIPSSQLAQHLAALGLVAKPLQATKAAGVTLSALRRSGFAERRWDATTGAQRHAITDEGRVVLERLRGYVE